MWSLWGVTGGLWAQLACGRGGEGGGCGGVGEEDVCGGGGSKGGNGCGVKWRLE